MFFTQSSIKKPKKSFNLLHLESNEIYFLSLKVAMQISVNQEEINGKLHLCSRSLVFEPFDIDYPLIKMKYSNSIQLKLFKNINMNKLKYLLNSELPIIKITEEYLDQICNYNKENLSNQFRQQYEKDLQMCQNNKNKKDLIEKTFKNNQVLTQPKDKIINIFAIQVDKLFLIYRNPISPYLTEKNNQNLIFSIMKSNIKQHIYRFLKIFDGFYKAYDETDFVQFLINSTIKEGIKEFRNIKVQQKQEINQIFQCTKFTAEGPVHGIFCIFNQNNVIFYTLVNNIDQKMYTFKLSDVKYFSKYRFQFKYTAIEI